MNQAVPTKSKGILFLGVSISVAIGSVLFILLHHEDRDDRVAFTLQDTRGNSVMQESLKGKWSILVFGSTHCPDICPSQAFTIAESLKILERYLAHFHPNFLGLLGSKLQLDLTEAAFDASYSVSAQTNASTDVEASIYLIDPSARASKQLPFETSAVSLVKILSTLI